MSIKEEKDKFLLVAKRILKENLTSNEETLNVYKDDIITAYNKTITFVIKFSSTDRTSDKTKTDLKRFATYVREKILLCFGNLRVTYNFPEDLFHLIEPTEVKTIDSNQSTQGTVNYTFTPSEDEEDSVMTSKEDFYSLATRAMKSI